MNLNHRVKGNLQDLLGAAFTTSNGRAVHFARSRRDAEVGYRIALGVIDEQFISKRSAAQLSITLKNGAVIEFKSTHNLDSTRGFTLDAVLIDDSRKEVLHAILPCVRRDFTREAV